MAVEILAGPDQGAVWHHGSPVSEQRAMQAGTAVVDRGHHEVLEVRGADRLTLLHALTTQQTEGLAPGTPISGLVLSPQGHIEHGFRGVDDGTSFWAVTEPGGSAGLAAFLTGMTFMMRVQTIDRTADFRLVWAGSQVPTGDARGWASEVAGGRDVLLPRDAALPEATPAGTWAYEALRIAAGVPRIGIDTDHKTIPNEIGLYGTHLEKGCYRGQETVARVHNLGRPPRRLTRLLLDGSVDTLPPTGSEVHADGRVVGVMGSSARHHEDGPIGLALVKRGVAADQTLTTLGDDGTEIAAGQDLLVDPDAGLHFRANLR